MSPERAEESREQEASLIVERVRDLRSRLEQIRAVVEDDSIPDGQLRERLEALLPRDDENQ